MDHDLSASGLPTGEAIPLAQGLLAELNQTLERARDERFRLIRLVKDCESRLGHVDAAPSRGALEKLLARVEQLNEAVRVRFEKLEQVDVAVDRRTAQLTRLEAGIRELTARFTEQVARARDFDRDIIDARRRLEAEADAVTGSVHARVAAVEAGFQESARKLEELSQSLAAQQGEADRVVAQTAAMIQRQVERAARETREHVDAIVEPFAARVQGLVDGGAAGVEQAVSTGRRTIREQVDAIVAEARDGVQSTADLMSQVLTGELQQQVDAHRQTLAFRDAALRDELEKLLNEREQQVKTEVEDHLRVLVEQTRERMLREIGERVEGAQAEAEDAVERVSGLLTARTGEMFAAAEQRGEALTTSLRANLDAALQQAEVARDDAMAKLREHATSFQGAAQSEVARAAGATQERLRRLVAQSTEEAESLIGPLSARLNAALESHRGQIEEIVATQERADEDREKSLRQRMTATLDDLRERTQTLQQDLIAHAQQAIRPVEAALRQTMADARAEVEQQLAQHAAALRPQVQADLEAAEAQIRSRLSRLRGDAESMVEMMERQLEKRIAAMEERAMQTSHDAERGVRERLERMRSEVEQTLAPLRRQTSAELERITQASRAMRVTPRTPAPALEEGDREVTTLPIIDSARLADSLQNLGRVRRDAESSADQAA